MLRAMVFIDFENFDIAKFNYYKEKCLLEAQEEAKNNKYFENKDIREIVSEIKRINKLDNLDLKEGQKLVIPTY